MTFTITAEIEASDLFANESINWRFCEEFATFKHTDVCEYVLHIGDDWAESDSAYDFRVSHMRAYGCTPAFIKAYEAAAKAGAVRVLFYV